MRIPSTKPELTHTHIYIHTHTVENQVKSKGYSDLGGGGRVIGKGRIERIDLKHRIHRVPPFLYYFYIKHMLYC